jgi:hypothetical protein
MSKQLTLTDFDAVIGFYNSFGGRSVCRMSSRRSTFPASPTRQLVRGFSAAERVAVVRPTGRSDGHLAVWIVCYIFIRNLEQNVCGPDEYQPKLIHETLMNDELAANALCASLCQGASPGNNFTRSSEPPSWMA